jgi:hypothetical protein
MKAFGGRGTFKVRGRFASPKASSSELTSRGTFEPAVLGAVTASSSGIEHETPGALPAALPAARFLVQAAHLAVWAVNDGFELVCDGFHEIQV